MGVWHFLAIGAIVVASWQVSVLYRRRCSCAPKELHWHGALEFNATFFSLQFLLLWFVGREKSGSWIIFALGLTLGLLVLRRFVRNWRKSGSLK
jgi:hypothetical protein